MNPGRILGFAIAAVLVTACHSEDGSTRAKPVSITVLKATPATIASGDFTTLEWAARNAKVCTGAGDLPGWAGPKDSSGTLVLVIDEVGTYQATLECEGADGSTDAESVTVTVNAESVTIDSFAATPATVQKDGSTTLTWSSSNATGCSAGGTLPGWTGAKAAAGSEPVSVPTVGSFEASLTCVDADGGSASETLAVTVTELPPAVTIDLFSADPSTFVAGGSTQLTWASSSATSCTAGGDLPGWVGDIDVDGAQLLTVTTDGTFAAELSCTDGVSSAVATITVTATLPTRHRYSMANGCFALKSAATGNYVQVSGNNLTASAADVTDAEPFYLKATALGDYLLYRGEVGDAQTPAQVVTAGVAPSNPTGATCAPGAAFCQIGLLNATESSIFEVKGAGDATDYPRPPAFDTDEPPEVVAAYRAFSSQESNGLFSHFTFKSKPDTAGRLMTEGDDGSISLAAATDPLGDNQQFILIGGLQNCPVFPEGNSNATGKPFKGTTPDNRVVGYVDPHIHVTSTTFLGGAKWGAPFHKFGIPHALGSCLEEHGENGSNDATYAVYKEDVGGHNTDGWPTFPSWPARNAITHEAQYWKWMERAWLGGMRLLVNDLVDNGTLCELVRNQAGGDDPDSATRNCNEMESARKQASTSYAMQDYIDAQYGGRGEGFWQVVWTPAEARQVIADGKMGVILGLELTNTFDCQLTYRQGRQKEPWEEPDTFTVGENSYKCTKASIAEDMDLLISLGLRKVISIHEFDIAFGGNGIFGGDVLNLGSRENSGGNPTPGVPPNNPFDGANPNPGEGETPSGEFWTTYDCATEEELASLDPNDGYLWGSSAGDELNKPVKEINEGAEGQEGYPPGWAYPAGCAPGQPGDEMYQGQGGRHGGAVACYPNLVNQCNARWMTPIGLHFYKLAMEKGLLIDFDHMAVGMKDQLLELAGAQDIPYPIVSTHGTYGGITLNHARRVLEYGGLLFDGVGSSGGMISNKSEVKPLWDEVADSPYRTEIFGYGFSTDTNGFSSQASPRGASEIDRDGGIVYPFTFFNDPVFDAIPEFATLDDDDDPSTPYEGVVFSQPSQLDLEGNVVRQWHPDEIDPHHAYPGGPEATGTAHGGMVTDMIQELRLQAIAAAQNDSVPVAARVEHVRDLYNSAEMFLQTWERTFDARDGIAEAGVVKEPTVPILRQAWGPENPPPWEE